MRLLLIAGVLALSAPAFAQGEDKPGLDIPKGQIEGKMTRADTGEPVGRQWMSLTRGPWSRSGSTDTFGRFEFTGVPAGKGYVLSFYHNGFKDKQFGPFDVADAQTVPVDWKPRPVDPQVAPFTYSDTYLPGQNITVMVRSIRVTHVDVDVFRVPAAAIEEKRSGAIDRTKLTIDPSWKPMLTYRQPVSSASDLDWRSTQVSPAFPDAGAYLVRVSGAGSQRIIPILVTRLALVTKRTPNAVWVWATDLETGAPVPGVKIVGEAVGKDLPPASLLAAGATGKNGLLELKGAHKANIRYWGVTGESIAYVDTIPASSAQALAFRAYVYSDRPVYRPGDEVHYKVVARANEGGVYRVVPSEKWDVVVRDPEGEVAWRSSHETSLFGTFAGAFTLPETPALGVWSVQASSGSRQQSGSFKVSAYRKPDYQLTIGSAKKQYVQGDPIDVTFDAHYYFGAPLRGLTVNYTIYETQFRPWWYDSYYGDYEGEGEDSYGYGEVANSGTVELDDEGRAQVKINVDRASIDRWVTVEATVSDATGREVSARHKIMVTRGTFSLGIRPSGKVFKVGETATFAVDASRFDGEPSSRKVTVTASLESFSPEHRIWIYRTLDSKSIETDTKGKATYAFPVKRDGFIRVEVAGKDEYGNPIVQSSFIWATKGGAIAGGYKKKSLDILPDKASYVPGDTARVLINSSKDGAWVLFAVEGDGVFEPQVVKVRGNSRLFEIPLEGRHAPNVYLSVAFTSEKQFYSLSKSISVSPQSRLLKIAVESDKKVYEPGKTARYDVTVVDWKGQPVQAELSAGLVDAALYAVESESTPNIGSFFYGHRPNPVQTAYSYPQRYLGGADKDGEEEGAGVRRDFKDTAFWKAVVTTGADGKATIDVPLPDNLTTWRLTLRAVSKDTLVGSTTHEIKTSKDLMATIALPRFFRQGDRVEVVGMIHNLGESLKGVTATLSVDGAARLAAAAERTFDIDGATSTGLRWPVEITGPGDRAIVRIAVKGGKLTDAEERSVPVTPVSVPRLEGVSGMSGVPTQQEFTVPEGVVPGTLHFDVRLSPTLAGAVVQSLEDLAHFPYGCVEQTMSSFLPDLIASKVLATLKVPRSGKLAELPAMVKKGLRGLYALQHEGGGWGWWVDDADHPYMTAYVVYGLGRAKAAGFDIKDEVLEAGVESAMKQFEATADPDTRSFIAYAIASAPKTAERQKFLADSLPPLRAAVPQMTSYSVATLVLAHALAGKAAEAGEVADALRKLAVETGSEASFPGRTWHYSWVDNAKEATAYAVRALLAVAPNDPLVPKAVRWLMAKRRGGFWDTTKDTAAAVEALVTLMEKTHELESSYTANLSVNGTPIGTLAVTPATAVTSGANLTVPASALKEGKNTLAVALDGKGVLYWNGQLRYGASPEARTAGLVVAREYRKTVLKKNAEGQSVLESLPIDKAGLTLGDDVEVRITVKTERPLEYLAVEDPLPAGFEVVPGVTDGATRREVRDDKVAFFVTAIPQKGVTTLVYHLRAEMAGTVTAAPTAAWLMYMPEVSGNGDSATLQTAGPAGL